MKKQKLESFENFEVEPSRDLWNKIESNLPATKKRRWYYLWIIPALLVLFAGVEFAGIRSFFNSNDSQTQVKRNVQPSMKQSQISEEASAQNFSIQSDPNLHAANPDADHASPTMADLDRAKILSRREPAQSSKIFISGNRESNANEESADTRGLYASIDAMQLSKTDLKLNQPEYEIQLSERNNSGQKHVSFSRWTIYAGAGVTSSQSHTSTETAEETNDFSSMAINSLTFQIGAGYDLSPRIKLSTGVSFIKAGQEQNSSTMIHLHGTPGDPNNTYSFTSGVGNLTGNGQEFNNAYFGSADSLLFHPTNALVYSVDSVATRTFSLREEFNYIQVPVGIIYKPIERRFTPFAGAYVSAAYLLNNNVELNAERLNYQYEEVSKILFSAGLKLGVEYRFTNALSFYANGYYQEGLNAVIKESNWKPYVFGVVGGVSYRFKR